MQDVLDLKLDMTVGLMGQVTTLVSSSSQRTGGMMISLVMGVTNTHALVMGTNTTNTSPHHPSTPLENPLEGQTSEGGCGCS